MYVWSLVTLYNILRVEFASLAIELFNGSEKIVNALTLMKNLLEKYYIWMNLLIAVYCYRYFLDYEGITDIFVRVFGRSGETFLGAKAYFL